MPISAYKLKTLFLIKFHRQNPLLMKHYFYLILFIIMLIGTQSEAQDFLPFVTSNYAGVTGVSYQPASIADSRYKFDMSLSATNFAIKNNFYSFDPSLLWHPNSFNDPNFFDKNLVRNINGNSKSAILTMKQDLFSFMVQLSPKVSIAFTPSIRSITNIDNITEDLAIMADSGLMYHKLWNKQLQNANVSVQSNTWVEYGFTYARVLIDNKKNFLKAGSTIKLTQGIGSAYMFINDLNYKFNNNDTLSLYNSNASYGASGNFGKDYNYHFDFNPSLCFDFGAVYEFRPDWMKYKYDMDGKTNLWDQTQDKYLFKIGVTVSDLGWVRYVRNSMSRDFKADIRDMYIGDITVNSVADVDTLIQKNFHPQEVPSKYYMNVPTALSIQTDMRMARGLYLNVTPYFAFKQGNKDHNKVHYLSAISIVPRYDLKWFGVSFPVQYDEYKQWNAGFGLRLGPLWIGSTNLLSLLMSSKNQYGASASMALKVPVFNRRPRDRDHDNVSDRKDKCPKVPGLWEMQGCPDADHDGVTDADDKCPTVPGLKELDGCPDRDGDGITDEKDKCPDVKGLAQFDGCPDSDGDGIIDQDDECPFSAGTAKMKGCPDQDDDGIADKDDKCPTVAGPPENHGCPFVDTDGDGVMDDVDNCPLIKGPPENHGCPYTDTDNDGIPDKDDECPTIPGTAVFKGCPDTDGDGISDKYDLCPTIPGVPENHGCPEIKKEEQDIIKSAFDNLEFETGKSIIRASSLQSLDELAGVMKKRPVFKLSLAGHTDDVGTPQSNMALSRNRTMAVKNYLVKKGVEEKRIKTEWYGRTQPIAPNTTPEGRQKNRRVEMKIIFE